MFFDDPLIVIGVLLLLFKFLGYAFILGLILYVLYHFLGAILQMIFIGVITIITICTLFYALFI